MRFEARHEPCGTVVADDLPEGYPVQEGVGLYCPSCRQAFWHVPPAPAPAPAPAAAEPALAATAAPPPRRRVIVRLWPALALILAPALVALAVVWAIAGGEDAADRPRPAPAPTATVAAPAPTGTETPSPAAAPRRAVRRVAGVRVSVAARPGWRLRTSGRRLVATGPGRARVTVSAAPRRGRSLAQVDRAVRGSLPGPAARSGRVSLGGRRAVRITAAGREVTALVLGRRRWVVARRVASGGRAIARSVRIG